MMLVVGALVGMLVASPAPAEVRDAARAVLSGAEYQTELPENEATLEAEQDPRTDSPGAPREQLDDDEMRVPAGGPLGFIASALLYVMLGVAVVLLIFWLVSELKGYEKEGGEEGGDAPAVAVDDAVVAQPLGDADTLARQGRFSEAIHVLLLRTLEELVRRLPSPLPRSFTSREILGRVRLPSDARTALSGLVTAVELCHFGNDTPGEGDYRACVDRFRAFAAAYTRGQGQVGA